MRTELLADHRPATATPAELLVLPVFAGGLPGPGTAEVDAALGGGLLTAFADAGCDGALGDLLGVSSLGRLPARTVLLAGLGPAEDVGPAAVRSAGAHAGRFLANGRRRTGRPVTGAVPASPGPAPDGATVASTLGQLGPPPVSAQALAEGLLIGAYRPSGAGGGLLARVVLLVAAEALGPARTGLARAAAYAEAVQWTRDLVNQPAAEATPARLAEVAREMAAAEGIDCRVWEPDELARDGFGGVLGVGAGSRNRPRFVELRYHGGGRTVLGLAGKGITFDAGGLHLKRQEDLTWMRVDMAGAAAVLAAVRALARLDVAVEVAAALPFAENLPGGGAIRPGDVLTHRGGRRSEVIDTDNEGRLILADALAHLAALRAETLVDVGTLTDAGGLGPELWAVLASDRGLAAELLAAGQAVGEPGWELPLWQPYRCELDSEVADVRNAPRGEDTTIAAALFLQGFTGGLSWAHIDNGSSAWMVQPHPPWPEGATGSPVRTLVAWAEARAGSGWGG